MSQTEQTVPLRVQKASPSIIRPEPIALLDMDGTVADFDKSMHEHMSLLASPEDKLKNYDPWDETKQFLTERRRLIKKLPGFWRDLPRLELGFDIVRALQSLEFEIHMFTKGPKQPAQAWTEKVEWVQQQPELQDVQMTITRDKGPHYGMVLVDDWPAYVTRWLEHRPRGLVVMVQSEKNKSFQHSNVIKYDGTNLKDVTLLLGKVRERAAGEDWRR